MYSEKAKKVIITVSLGGAVLLLGAWILDGGSGRVQGVDSVPEGAQVWVKCANKACAASSEMAMKEYYRKVDEKVSYSGVPPIECEKCGKASVFRAIKCNSCGEVVAKSRGVTDECRKCASK
jgi:hypothetical protein